MTSRTLHARPSLLALVISAAFPSVNFALPAPQAPPVVQELKAFAWFPSGRYPNNLIQGTDGALYGTAAFGGARDSGTLFKSNTDGTGFEVLLDFGRSISGADPDSGVIQATDGVLYGTTAGGGSHFRGTVYKVNPDGTGATVLVDFDEANSGANPEASLIQGQDGALYGTAMVGGSFDDGTVFKLNTDGTGFQVLVDLDLSTTGGLPRGALIQGNDGTLYGTTGYGGSFKTYGTLFKLNPDGTGFKVLFDFDQTLNGRNAGLLQGTDGALYGTFGDGVFKLNTDGTGLTVVFTFNGPTTGVVPQAGLIQGKDGALYGTTIAGGAFDLGTVFKVNPDGTGFVDLTDFNGPTYYSFSALLQGTDGAIYGTTTQPEERGSSTIFKLNPDGTGFNVLRTFSWIPDGELPRALLQGKDGALYGSNYPMLFKLNVDGTGFSVLRDLTDDNPVGTAMLIQGSDGALYGASNALFKLNPDGSGLTVLFDIANSAAGAWSGARLLQASDGALYGTTTYGGSHGGVPGFGTAFKVNPDGTGFTILLDFDGATTGGNPSDVQLLQGTDGALYGTTSSGGSSGSPGFGTVFKLNTDGTGFSVLLDFDGSTTGGSPIAGLIQGSDGALYGTASMGGRNNDGTVFKLNPDGSGFQVLVDLDRSTSGFAPLGLMLATNGRLYGLSSFGGSANRGTIFSLRPDGSDFTVFLDFATTTVAYPLGPSLIQGMDGALYGTTYSDNDNGAGGSVYRLIFTAAWSNYGAGLPGTNGVPNFASSADPVLGTTITLSADNSRGRHTTGYLLAGLRTATIPFKQGTLLIGDIISVLPLSIPASGFSLDAAIPDDASLCGLELDLQILESDPGAPRGVSLTPGLSLMLGR